MEKRQRANLSTIVDAALLDAVDQFVAEQVAAHRSQVIDEALRLWTAREQERAIKARYTTPRSMPEQEEQTAWRHLWRAAATRLLCRSLKTYP